MQRVVAVFLLFRHEGKFGVAFDEGGVEGGELVASLMLACADQQFVGQVATATQGTDGLSISIFVFKPKVVNLQKTCKRFGDFGWYRQVVHIKLEPMKAVAKPIKERRRNVVSYCTHKITNGVAEGMHNKITSIKRRAGGFRNRENFKTAIFFYCGGLILDPQ